MIWLTDEVTAGEACDPSTARQRRRSFSNASTADDEILARSDDELEATLIFPTSTRRKGGENPSPFKLPIGPMTIVNSELEEAHRLLWSRAADALAELEAAIEHFSIQDLRGTVCRVKINETVGSTLLLRRRGSPPITIST
jgi:hypothetical protein